MKEAAMIIVFRELVIQSMIQAKKGSITVEILSEFRENIKFIQECHQPRNFKALETSLSAMPAFKESRKNGEASDRIRDMVIADETV